MPFVLRVEKEKALGLYQGGPLKNQPKEHVSQSIHKLNHQKKANGISKQQQQEPSPPPPTQTSSSSSSSPPYFECMVRAYTSMTAAYTDEGSLRREVRPARSVDRQNRDPWTDLVTDLVTVPPRAIKLFG